MCVRCGEVIERSSWRERSTLCAACRPQDSVFEQCTLGEVRGDGNAVKGRYAYIRGHARKTYAASGQPRECRVCGYSTHIEIAHVADINGFSDDTKIAVINHIDNLVPLCRNHHWEFDHGILRRNALGLPSIWGYADNPKAARWGVDSW